VKFFNRLELLLCLCCPIIAWAQITVQWTDFPTNPGTVINRQFNSLSSIPLNPGPAGPNQTWDFTNISVSNSEEQTWVDPATTPHYALYPDANRCYTVGYATFGYFGLTPSSYSWYGYDATVFQDVTSYWTLPCSHGDTWTSTWWYSPSTQMTVENSLECEVDGWGTLTDEMGSLPCLRLKIHWTSTMTLQGNPTVMTTWRYEWIVPGYGVVVTMESTIDEPDPNFTEGFFRRMVSISSGVHMLPAEPSLPNQVTLSPAFPNPFNPSTQISFSLPKPGIVSLVVFDQLGRQVAQLASGRFAVGQYQAAFDGSLLASGPYLANLSVDGTVYVQKLVLMK
jgi:hypothetical protein